MQKCGKSVCPTRWGQILRSLESVLLNYDHLFDIFNDNDFICGDRHQKERRQQVREIVNKDPLCYDIKKAITIYEPFVKAILHFESDATPISDVYHVFNALSKNVDTLNSTITTEEKAVINLCIKERWNFLFAMSYGISYLLDPRYLGDAMDEATFESVFDYISFKYPYKCSGADRSASAELTDFLNKFKDAREEKPHKLNIFTKAKPADRYPQVTLYEYWKSMNDDRWAHLKEIALMVFSLCTTSASCERSFSNQGHVHSKLRNRLLDERVQKLLFCYHNLRQLAQKRKRDHAEEDEFEGVDFPDTNDNTEDVEE